LKRLAVVLVATALIALVVGATVAQARSPHPPAARSQYAPGTGHHGGKCLAKGHTKNKAHGKAKGHYKDKPCGKSHEPHGKAGGTHGKGHGKGGGHHGRGHARS